MTKFYSKATGGFYDDGIHATMPDDARQISQGDYAAAMSRKASETFSFDVDGTLKILPSPAPTLDALKMQAIDSLNAQAEAVASQLTAGYPEFEMKTWPDQQAEALAWNADNTAATPCLDALASYRGIDRVDYIQKTLAKVNAYRSAAWYLAGTRQGYIDQINAATTKTALKNIVPTFTLPS